MGGVGVGVGDVCGFGFEGVEKRYVLRLNEGVFAHLDVGSLREVEDHQWQGVLDKAVCHILSKIKSVPAVGPPDKQAVDALAKVTSKKKRKTKRRKTKGKRASAVVVRSDESNGSPLRGCVGAAGVGGGDGSVTAYLLSESSLFVYDDTIVLKTCGTTTPLLCTDALLHLLLPDHILSRIASHHLGDSCRSSECEWPSIALSSVVDYALFTHLNYRQPQLQTYPHRTFNEEVSFLKRYFPSGEAFELQTAPDSTFSIFLYQSPISSNQQRQDQPPAIAHPSLPSPHTTTAILSSPNGRRHHSQPHQQTQKRRNMPPLSAVQAGSAPDGSHRPRGGQREQVVTLTEWLLIGIDPKSVERFAGRGEYEHGDGGEGGEGGGRGLHFCGALRDLLPSGAEVDQYWFAPQGYSCNALAGPFFLNAHISPEPETSYASVEVNFPFGIDHGMSCEAIQRVVVECFRPREVHLVHIRPTEDGFVVPAPSPLHQPCGGDSSSHHVSAVPYSKVRQVEASGSSYRVVHSHYSLQERHSVKQAGGPLPPLSSLLPPSPLQLPSPMRSPPLPSLTDSNNSDNDSSGRSSSCTNTSATPSFILNVDGLDESISSDGDGSVSGGGGGSEALEDLLERLKVEVGMACVDGAGGGGGGDGEVGVVRELVDQKRVDGPFVVVDIQRVIDQYRQWQRLLPKITPYYAVKCNPDPVLVRVLAALGARFDCASQNEIRQVLDLGAQGSDIVYANPCKQVSGLAYARQHNVQLMTFDNQDELHKIAAHHPSSSLLLRIQTDDTHAVCPMSCKFGAPEQSWRVLLQCAKALNLSVVGVCFHVGSGCKQKGAFSRALRDARRLFDLGVGAGFDMRVLDIGGGFPCEVEDGGVCEGVVTFPEMAREITDTLDELFDKDVQVIAEPGRYFAGACHTLAVRVFARRAPTETTADEGRYLYYVNDGLYGSFNCLLYDHATVTPELLREHDGGPVYRSTVFGPTCDGFDVILKDVMLPIIEMDEWLVFRNMGAYTTAACSTFNGFSKPKPFYCRVARE
ncbi:unnamed protein product [Vitrella brassicaformis CCMP3155]|uniref:ornithine decarboxylase n=2 Tax=Vitrella brassicaformis TaxID=1169539 RepID=A0A0G4EYD2_VITBC|nr:unnamed protein product [Vitrella brassicaformis CCMP3155]|eukprot:CEM03971.1 unnamed protein product [Vitrella brassicaformis CCMP3155]